MAPSLVQSSKGLILGSDGKLAGAEAEMAAWNRVVKGLISHAEEFAFYSVSVR